MVLELNGTRGITLPTLRKGDKGADVKALQKALIEVGFSINGGKPNGVYGPATKSAVEMYQAQEHIRGGSDGIAGKYTLEALGFDWRGPKVTPKPTPKPTPEPDMGDGDNPLTAPMTDWSKYLLWGGVAVLGVLVAKKKGWLKRKRG